MEDERALLRAIERAAEALERTAAAQEHLNDLAASQALPEPPSDQELFDAPVCPHCGTFDPFTRMKGGEGSLSKFVLATPCGTCGKSFYAIPIGWRILASSEAARQILEATPTDEG